MFPYNRIVVWAAGPISILAGWVATQLVQHVGLFGPLGLGQDKIAHAIVVAVTFAVSALVTYAAHHKWLDNLGKLVMVPSTSIKLDGRAVAESNDAAAKTAKPDGPAPSEVEAVSDAEESAQTPPVVALAPAPVPAPGAPSPVPPAAA